MLTNPRQHGLCEVGFFNDAEISTFYFKFLYYNTSWFKNVRDKIQFRKTEISYFIRVVKILNQGQMFFQIINLSIQKYRIFIFYRGNEIPELR